MGWSRPFVTFCAAVFCVALMFFASGCWDSINIESRGFVVALGLEPVKDRDDKDISVTIMMPPTRAAGGRAGGGQGEEGQGGAEGGPQKAFVVEEKGLFLEDAVEEMRSKVGGIIDFSALEFLVIGNGLGPDDLWRSLNTVLFFRHIPLASLVLATEEDVGKLMRLSPASGKTFSEVLSGLQAQSRQGLGNVYFPMTWKVMSIIRNEAGDIVLPLMGLTEKGDGLEAIGTAVYDGARRAGRLGPTDSMLLYGIAWRKHLGGTYIMRHAGREFSVRIISMKTKVSVTGTNVGGMPRIGVKLSVAARLLDSGGYRVSIADRSQLNELKAAAERDLENRLREILVKLKEWNSDAMRLYHALRPKMPSISYDEFKRMYPELEVDFEVSMDLRRAGLLR
ncbi:MAG: Ger(x)C family spore germination C-terminal domain-containing protein [Bacillota bacterium]|nr:Ger(x)C family spore germination C-terminal domain-containing protein [Bacillota bacterium]